MSHDQIIPRFQHHYRRIDLSRSRKGKDFGSGFYLNADKEQSRGIAVRTTRIMKTGIPTVNSYLSDDTILSSDSDLKIKVFDGYSPEWAEFVLKNRENISDTPVHPYDIVVGPIADDTVGVQINRYILGYIDVETLIEDLKFKGSRAVQYFFGTEKAISLLKNDGYER